MKWVLIVMLSGNTPYDTGLVFDTLDQCYVAEESMTKTEVGYLNNWIAWAKEHPKESTYPPIPDFISSRVARGVCMPHK